MKVFTLSSQIRGARYITLLLLLVAFSATMSVLTIPNTAYAAPSEQECYALNDEIYNSNIVSGPLNKNREAQEQCRDTGYCSIVGVSGTATSKKSSCSREVYEKSSQYALVLQKQQQAAVTEQQAAPVVAIICGTSPEPTCKAAVQDRYSLCANNANDGGSPTQEQINSAISGCMQSWAANTYPDADLSDIQEAIAQGINDANKVAQEQGQAATQEKIDACKAEGKIYDSSSGTCVAGSTCQINGIGWIVCPVMNFLANIADNMKGVLNDFLMVPSASLFAQSGGDSAFEYWKTMRNIGNVMFIIAFMIIVFSQVTSIGLSNYGIKKLLPKLIIVAILANISFYICAIAVDISNFLGVGLSTMVGGASIAAIPNPSPPGSTATEAGAVTAGFIGIVGTLLIGGAVVYFNLAFIASLLVSVIMVGVVVILALTIRQALIILLIVLSPIAFVCMLLPNTETVYKKWFSVFKGLLILFPIVGLLFGAATLASKILGNVSGNMLVQAIGSALPFLVLIAVYTLTKKAINTIDGLDGVMNNVAHTGSKANQALTGGIREHDKRNRKYAAQGTRMNIGKFGKLGQKIAYGGMAKDNAISFRDREAKRQASQMYADKVTKNDGNNLYTKRMTGGDSEATTRAFSNAKFTIDKAIAENIEAETVTVRDKNETQLKEILQPGSKASDEKKAAAMQRLVTITDPDQYASEVNSALRDGSETLRRATAEALSKSSELFKASDIDNYATGSNTTRDSSGNITGFKSIEDTIRKNMADGVMSQEKMLKSSSGSIEFAYNISNDTGKKQLEETARDLLDNTQLQGSIRHNKNTITTVASSVTP